MPAKESNRQDKMLSRLFKGKGILKPMDTGWVDDHVACVREKAANVFFYTKDEITIMIDAGGDYDRLSEKMVWLGIKPDDVIDILLTHQDPDRASLLVRGGSQPFEQMRLYIGALENEYLTGLVTRKSFGGLNKQPKMELCRTPSLLRDGQVIDIEGIRVEAILTPGHTWGHMVYLIDNAYLFTGDALWLGGDGGYGSVNVLSEDNEMAVKSLQHVQKILKERGLKPRILTAHTGWTDDLEFAFKHADQVCNALKKLNPYPADAPVDAYNEDSDTEDKARTRHLMG